MNITYALNIVLATIDPETLSSHQREAYNALRDAADKAKLREEIHRTNGHAAEDFYQ